MNDFDTTCNNIIANILDLFLKINEDRIYELINEFVEKWRLKTQDELKALNDSRTRTREDIAIERQKLQGKRSIFFGETSAGKSTLINKLLQSAILPSTSAETTNSFIQIKFTNADESYFKINGEKETKHKIKELETTVNARSLTKVKSGSHVYVYLSRSEWSLPNTNIAMIDTPGIDVYTYIDQSIVKYCKMSHLIILVVDSNQTITNKIKEFINNVKTSFSKVNICFVFNKWDQIKEEERKETRRHHLGKTVDIMCNKLGYSIFTAIRRIFFLSAATLTEPNIHNPNYKPFFTLVTETRDSETANIKMRLSHIKELYESVWKEAQEQESVIKNIQKEMSVMESPPFVMIDEMKKKISLVCRDNCEEFIEEAWERVKIAPTKRQIDQHSSSKQKNIKLMVKKDEINELLKEKVKKSFESLREEFKNLIKDYNLNYLMKRVTAEDNEYFPLNCEPQIFLPELRFTDILFEIKKKQLIAKVGTIAGVAAVTAGAFATGGALLAPVLAIEGGMIAVVGVGAGATGAAVGGGVSGLSTNILSKLRKEPFKYIRDMNDKPIRDAWITDSESINPDFKYRKLKEEKEVASVSLQEELTETYSTYINDTKQYLQKIFEPLENEFLLFQIEMGEVKEKITNLERECHLPQ